MDNLPTKALSVRQPWAWAIIHGGKDIENRSRPAVKHGMTPGSLCIHAAKGMTRYEYEGARDFMASIGVECPRPDDLIRGAVIGTVIVTDIVEESDSDWFFGPRGLVLSDQMPVDPIPATGALGYFKWQPGGEAATPLPWMMNWPTGPKPKHREIPIAATPLFDSQI